MANAFDLVQHAMRALEGRRERAMRGEGGVALESDPQLRGGHVIDPAAPATVPRAADGETGVAIRFLREFEPGYVADAARFRPFVGYDEGSMLRVGDRYDPLTQTVHRRAPAPPKEPSTITVTGEPIDAEYAALAQELGVNTALIEAERFKTWVTARGLRVYHRAEVQAYLNHKYGVPPGGVTPTVRWGWRPLRKADRSHRNGHDHRNGAVQGAVEPYAKPIPLPVLLTIKEIRDEFPSANFFVSDELEGERIPDPFLLVRVGAEEFVVERWDEPSFRGKA